VEPNSDDKEKIELYRQAVEVVVIFYLDRAILDQHDPSKLDDIRRTIRRVNFSKQQAPILLQKWNAEELKGFVHERTIQALHGIILNK
jgi:virulence-associated protein VapD